MTFWLGAVIALEECFVLDVVSWLPSLTASQGIKLVLFGLLLCLDWLYGLTLEFHILKFLRVDQSSAFEVSKGEGALQALWLAHANMTCRGDALLLVSK